MLGKISSELSEEKNKRSAKILDGSSDNSTGTSTKMSEEKVKKSTRKNVRATKISNDKESVVKIKPIKIANNLSEENYEKLIKRNDSKQRAKTIRKKQNR